jgi:hypothetical protein
MVRTSNPLDIGRATAREDASGHPLNWAVQAYAICARRTTESFGLHFAGTLESGIEATHDCSTTSGNEVVGPGGGGGTVDGGPVLLQKIYPSIDKKRVTVKMTGLFPDGRVLASPTCAA